MLHYGPGISTYVEVERILPGDYRGLLARISHRLSSRGGADGRGYKTRDEGARRHT
jgi:hypothetical protein